MISFTVSKDDAYLIDKIVDRAIEEKAHPDDRKTISMDVIACHANGCPLDLERLLKAPFVDFAHDLMGIRRHLDTTTGKLRDAFSPRCHARSERRAS